MQIPLTMACSITINKSQGLILQKETNDIGKVERQGLTFTTTFRIKSLNGICIQPTFSFVRYSKM